MSKREKQLFHIALLLVPIVLVSLASPAVAQTKETYWRLLRDIAPTRTGMPQLTIKGQALSGSTGCNSFTSTLTRQSDAKVHIDRPALTRKFCGGKRQGVENAFVDAATDSATVSPRARRGHCRALPENIPAHARGRKQRINSRAKRRWQNARRSGAVCSRVAAAANFPPLRGAST